MVATTREPTGVAGLDEALAAIVERAAELAEADVVVARLADDNGALTAHAVHAPSESIRAALEGSRIEVGSIPLEEHSDLELLPRALRPAAARISAVGVLHLAVRDGDDLVGSLELLRSKKPFDNRQRALARAAADNVALARRAFADTAATNAAPGDLCGAGGARSPRRRAPPVALRGPRAHAGAAGDRRAGDRGAVAGPHARDRRSARRGAARGGPARRLPRRGRPARARGGAGLDRPACAHRRAPARARARARPWPRHRGALGGSVRCSPRERAGSRRRARDRSCDRRSSRALTEN